MPGSAETLLLRKGGVFLLLFCDVIMNHTAPPAADRRQGVNNLYDNVAADASFRMVLQY